MILEYEWFGKASNPGKKRIKKDGKLHNVVQY